MARTVELTVEVDVESKSLADLKKEIQDIQAQLDLTPTGTKEYDNLVVRLREAKGEIKDFKEATKGLDPDQRAAKLVGAFQGMTGAIQSAAGALTLFGGNSEDLEKVEKNLLGIIAIGGGIQSTIEGYNDAVDVIGPKLSSLGQSIKASFTTASGAVNGFKVALAGIGIGLLITAVVLLADKLEGVDEASKKAAAGIAELAKKQKELRGELQALNETELATAERGLNEALELRKKISADQRILFDDLNRAETESQKLGIKERIAQKTLEYTQTEIDEAKFRAQIKAIQDKAIKDENDGLTKQSAERRKKAQEEKEKAAKEEAERLKAIEDARIAALDQLINAELSANEAARQKRLALAANEDEAVQIEYENKLAALAEAQIKEEIAVAGNAEAIALIRQKYADLQVVATQEVVDKEEALQAKRVADGKKADEDLAASAKKSSDEIIAAEEAKTAARNEFLRASQGAIQALGGLFKEGSDAAKAAGLVDIAVGTGIGFINALDIAQKSAKATGPAAAFAFPIFYASQIAAVLGAAGRAKAILKSGSGGAGGAPPVPPTPSAGGFGTQPAQLLGSFTPGGTPATGGGGVTGGGGIQEGGAQAGGGLVPVVKAYVLSGDVTDAQEAELKINQKRKF